MKMDVSKASVSSSDDEQKQKAYDSGEGRRNHHRHLAHQIQTLEAFFEYCCANPDENQRRELSKELGLEPKQIKFWFQNRRTQRKARETRQQNLFLSADKTSLESEIKAMREVLGKMVCRRCGGPLLQPQPDQLPATQQLQLENTQLKQELGKLTKYLANYPLP